MTDPRRIPPYLPLPVTLGFALVCACSSVKEINDRAILAQSDAFQAAELIEPPIWVTPVKTEYRIGSRDLLEIEVYELEEPDKSRLIKTRVSQSGHVVLPLIGRVVAGDKTAAELRSTIEARLGEDYLVNPSVSVLVAEYQARRVTILGAVESPGSFSLQENSTTFVDVLALAGGLTDKAGSTAFVVRANTEPAAKIAAGTSPATAGDNSDPATPGDNRPSHLLEIDLVDLMEHGNFSANRILQDGDFVHVPVAQHYFVTGYVNDPGAFPLRRETTLLGAIATAGGLKENATPSASILIRRTEQGRVRIPVDLAQIESGSAEDLQMMPEDVLLISQSGGDKILSGMGSFFSGLFNITYGVR